MTDIEKRANELYCDADGYVKGIAHDYMRIGYIKGATDQRKEDDEIIDRCFRLFKCCLVQRWGIAKDVADKEVSLLRQAIMEE